MMPDAIADPLALLVVLLGAFLAGFTTGFAGFGTGLVAAGFWFHALPAPLVPPVIALASVAAQLAGLATLPLAFAWRRLAPYLLGGAVGVPVGVLALRVAEPATLRFSVGAFLILYALTRLLRLTRLHIGRWGGRRADGVVGLGGGFLGGFAGLSAPLPLVWLQLRGASAPEQRAIYQPFNLIVLAMASTIRLKGW